MNPVLAGIALVLVVVFAALAVSRKRKEQQNWQVLAGLAAVFAVALAASVFIPPFEAAPPADVVPGAGESPGPVVVELEGVLRTPISACGDEFCFGLDVLRVNEGPKALEGEKNLNVTTDKEIVLLGGKIIRVYGEQAGGYGVLAPASNIKYVESDGSLSAPEVVQPEAQPAEAPIEVSFIGYPLGDWEVCGSKWCNRLQTFEYPGENGEPPTEFMVESDANPGVAAEYAVSGTLADGRVSATAIEPVLVVGEE